MTPLLYGAVGLHGLHGLRGLHGLHGGMGPLSESSSNSRKHSQFASRLSVPSFIPSSFRLFFCLQACMSETRDLKVYFLSPFVNLSACDVMK